VFFKIDDDGNEHLVATIERGLVKIRLKEIRQFLAIKGTNGPIYSAIFSASDEMAIGLLRGLKDAGFSVPRDVSVAGFDGIELNYDLDNDLSPKNGTKEYEAIRKKAEEIGLVGSRNYVEKLPDAERRRIVAMINLDMLAVGQELQIGGTDDLATRAIAAARDLGVPRVSRLGNDTARAGASDHASFMAAGIPSLFLNRPDDPSYHTAQDQVGHVRPEALRVAGEISLRVIDELLAR
jgi:hypothetical protein